MNINMKDFNSLIQQILGESRKVLLEMPVATRGYEYWVQGILQRLGNDGEKGWEQAGLRRKEGSNQRDYFNAEVFVFRTFSETIAQKIDFAITLLDQKGVIDSLQTLKGNVDEILRVANLATCMRSQEIKESFVDGLNSVPSTNNTLFIRSDWFIEMFIRAITEKLFSYIFKPNTDAIPVHDFYGRPPDVKPQGVLDFFNPAIDEVVFQKDIEAALIIGLDGKPPVLAEVALEFGFKYKKHVHDLQNTSRLLSQCRAEIVTDFETKHRKLRTI
jgi:hypothetical protein